MCFQEDVLSLNEDEQLAAAIAASLRETKVEKSSSNEDFDDSDVSQSDADISASRSSKDNKNPVTSISQEAELGGVKHKETENGVSRKKKIEKNLFKA